MALKMMIPPMVGVPDFSICPAKPRSRTVSPICWRLNKLMIRFPKKMDTISEVINAMAARNEMYWKSPAPGKFNESRKSNK
jgi:hypothetical protein